MSDPLISLLKERPELVKLMGRVWDILYVEGHSPDIGKRRENFFKLMLINELGLEVVSSPDTERAWDFKVFINNEWRAYSMKTTERINTIKVAWDGFPTEERVERFVFEYPILYVSGNRRAHEVRVCVFTQSTLENVRRTLSSEFWWIPKENTNPRGFGISKKAVQKLIEEAEKEDNCIRVRYEPVDVERAKLEYLKGWYELLKRIATLEDLALKHAEENVG